MKNKIFCILAAASLSAGTVAQNVKVNDFEVLSSGETVVFNIQYSDVSKMTSTHFELNLPSSFTVEKVEATTEWAALFSREGGVVSGMSTSGNAFNGEGNIARMTVSIPANTPLGVYPVTISNVRINGIDLGYEPTFNIEVVSAHSVVLDENSATAPEAAEGVNVTVKRTINAGVWSTICLPFAMTEAQCKAAFGDDVELADFFHCEATYDGDNVIKLNVEFQDVDIAEGMEANHPYIIKVSTDITEFTADDVDIEVDEASVDRDEYRTGTGSRKDPYVYHYNSLVGVYEAQTDVPELCLFLSGNKFWYSSGATQMKAFRAYFDFYDVLSDVEEAGARITIRIDENPTGIVSVTNSEKHDNVYYDLSGRRTEKPVKGIYIVNGKKISVK